MDIVDIAGGESVLPLLVAGAALGAIYSTGKALDSQRYWSDYYRNTGYRPRYPWRAGQYDWVGDAGRTLFYGSMEYYHFKKWMKS